MKNQETVSASAQRLAPGRLIGAALKARERAVAPYSKFKVVAALLTRSGKIVGGANGESASYGLRCCAEQVALFKALTAGEKDFLAVAIVGPGVGRRDALWCVPAIAGRVCGSGEGFRRRQPATQVNQRVFRS